MKLHAKIHPEMLAEILRGKKRFEVRQIESITLEDTRSGGKCEFSVKEVFAHPQAATKELFARHNIPYDPKLPCIIIELGKLLHVWG